MDSFNQNCIMTALALTAGLLHASPTSDATYPLIISHIVPLGQYNLTYWNDAPSTSTANTLPERASISYSGSNDVTCSGSHKADSNLCSQLLNNLSGNDGKSVANAPRAICLGQQNDQCCVSWSAAVGTMPQVDLFNAANKAFHSCFGSTILGLARNVNLNGGCVTERLSNRSDGCS
jgi:hypothetical protein